MKKILYSLALIISFLVVMFGISCEGWFSDPDEGNCGLVASNGINRRPILQSPEDQAIFVGPQQVTLKWWAQYGPKEDEHYRLFIDTIPINIWEQPNYEYTADTIFVTDTLEEGIYYWAVSLYTEKYSCGHIQGGGDRSFNILPLADLIKLMEPEDGAFDVDLEENLEWELISKTGKTDYLFDVYFDIDDPPSTLIGSDISDSFFKPTLAGRTTYYWKVVGKLDNAEDIESETWSFTTLNNPPDAFSLSSPDNEATNVALDTKLEWLAATDPDGDLVTYDVLLDINNPPEAQVANDITELSYVTTTESGATYYWQVIAKDDMGAATESEIWSFTTLNNAPESATLTSPVDGATDVALDIMLEWEASTDPDGDAVTYDILLETNNPPQAQIATGITGVSISPAVAAGTTYYWQVIAEDDKGAATESEIWSFTTTVSSTSYGVILLSPENEASDVPLNAELSWELNSENTGIFYEYDIYLDTNNPPSVMVGTHWTTPTYWTSLAAGTTYYWKIIGKDYFSGKTVESEVWQFKTTP